MFWLAGTNVQEKLSTSECDVVVLDDDEKEYDAGNEDIDKEDKELDKFILDD